MNTRDLTALVRNNVDVEVDGFTFQAVDKDEYEFYNHNERKRISQLIQVRDYYENQKEGYGYNVALLLDAIDYALAWLLDYEMDDIPQDLMGALVRHRDWIVSTEKKDSRNQARLKAFNWLIEELTELSSDNLWKYRD